MTANPLVATRVTMTTPLSGTFLLEDCETIGSGIRNGDWLEGGMGAFGAVADGVAMAVDPLGSVLAMGFGWLIDHMWPIKDWFSDLTGDAGEVAAFAATWDNIATHMQGVSDELTRTLADLDDQHGQFFDTYRKFQGENAAHAAAAGHLASAMGVGMQIASTIVKIVHDMTRDALTQLAGTAISAATTAALTLGFGTPWAVAQVATRVSALSARIGKYVTKLVKAVKELLPRLEDAARLFRSLRKALDEALESGKGALRTAVRKSDDVRTPMTYDELVQERISSGTWEDPGVAPSWASSSNRAETFFGEPALKYFVDDKNVPHAHLTLGAPGRPAFLMPSEDAALITSRADLVTQTGRAPSVEAAVNSGERIFGISVPTHDLDMRTPTFNDATDPITGKMNPNFAPGGQTAVQDQGLFTGNRTREATVDGGGAMPPGGFLFEWLSDGSRSFVTWL